MLVILVRKKKRLVQRHSSQHWWNPFVAPRLPPPRQPCQDASAFAQQGSIHNKKIQKNTRFFGWTYESYFFHLQTTHDLTGVMQWPKAGASSWDVLTVTLEEPVRGFFLQDIGRHASTTCHKRPGTGLHPSPSEPSGAPSKTKRICPTCSTLSVKMWNKNLWRFKRDLTPRFLGDWDLFRSINY